MVFCPGEEDYYCFKQFLSICFLILMCLLIRFWIFCLELFRKEGIVCMPQCVYGNLRIISRSWSLVSPENLFQVVSLGGKCLNTMSCVTDPGLNMLSTLRLRGSCRRPNPVQLLAPFWWLITDCNSISRHSPTSSDLIVGTCMCDIQLCSNIW